MDALNVVIIVLTAIMLLAVLARSMRTRRMLARLTPRELELHEQCVGADKSVAESQRAYDKAVKAAQKALGRAQTPTKLASAGGSNFVTPISLRLNGRDHELTQDVVAVLDTTGTVVSTTTQRTSLTRIAVGGLVAGPIGAVVGAASQKKEQHEVDTREHYVMVSGSDWQEVVKLGPEAGEQARALTQAINVAAKNVVPARIKHAEGVDAAQREVARATADTAALDGAKAAREVLGEDPLARLKRMQKTRSRGLPSATDPTAPHGPSTTGGLGGIASFDDPQGDGPQDTLR